MNNTTLGIIGGIVAVALVGGYFLKSGSEAEVSTTQEKESQDPGSRDVLSGTLKDLMGLGKDMECTFTQEMEGTIVTGKVYVADSGERVRVNYTAQIEAMDQVMTGSSIMKDGFNYTWGSSPLGTFGTKFAITDDAQTDVPSEVEGIDIYQNLDYTCEDWNTRDEVFELPSDVEFKEISLEVPTTDVAGEGMDVLQCNACDQIPDAGMKAECREAFGC